MCQLLHSCSAIAGNTPQVSVRLARRADIDAIAAINQRTLPENYTRQFYIQHLMRWPQLNYVAEADAATMRALSERRSFEGASLVLQDVEPGSAPPAGAGGAAKEDGSGREIIGYVLGRMDEPTVSDTPKQGHITSLAVVEECRRLGVAHALMACLHDSMAKNYEADSASLHVRVSNSAATRLYGDILGYTVSKSVSRYYHDGEDAYVMTKARGGEVKQEGQAAAL